MKSKVWESLAVILLASPLSAVAGDITYDVEQAVGTGSVVGTITTDGTIGVLSSADVVAWDLTLRAPNLSGGTQVLTQSNGTFSDTGGFGATANRLVFNYGGTTGQLFIFEGGSHSDYWCGAASGGDACNLESDPAETIGYSSVTGGNADADHTGDAQCRSPCARRRQASAPAFAPRDRSNSLPPTGLIARLSVDYEDWLRPIERAPRAVRTPPTVPARRTRLTCRSR